jgi:tetratricopeptide (TPR) repeat protein
VTDEALPTNLDEQAALYRSLLAARSALVVLDNASSADQLRPLLPASPTCLVLITSRDRLTGLVAQEGAQVLDLDVFAPEEAIELLARIAGRDRVEAEPEAAAEVARLCGYLPLAVRIVAARLVTRPTMSIATLGGRLADERHRLAELAAGDVEMRASFALSRQALSSGAARLFRRLGLIAGPDFAPGVSAALIDATPRKGEELLEALVDAHLVEVASTPGRYRFHDLLRLYARERVQVEETEPDRQATLRRMFDWYLNSAEAAYWLLNPERAGRRLPPDRPDPVFATHVEALAWFEAERPSVVAAIHQAVDCGMYPVAWRLPDAMWIFFNFRNYWADWEETHEVGLNAAREAHNRRGEARMLENLGEVHRVANLSEVTRIRRFHRDLGRFEKPLGCFQQALTIYKEIGQRSDEAEVLINLGATYGTLGRFEQSVECNQQARAIFREVADRRREGVALNQLGWGYRELGRSVESVECYQQALAIFGQLGDPYWEGFVLGALGDRYVEMGRSGESVQSYQNAIGCFQQALTTFQETGNRWGEGDMLDALAHTYGDLQRFEEAIDYFQQALEVYRGIGYCMIEDSVLKALAATYRKLGRFEEAIECYGQALAVEHQVTDRYRVGETLNGLAEVYCELQRIEEAIDSCHKALGIFGELNYQWGEATTLEILGLALQRLQDMGAAKACWRDALTIFTEFGTPEVDRIRSYLEEFFTL